MNICLVHEEYPEETNYGGIATYQKLMAEELVRQGNSVYVVCRGLTEDKNYIENGVNIKRIYIPETNNQVDNYINYRKKVAKILAELQQEGKIDIIEVPDWGAETIFFESERKIPLVVRLHTPLKVWLKYNKNNFGEIKELLLEWEEKMIKSADLITCCSNALKKIVINEFNVKSRQIHVTPNPANINNFYFDKKIEKENKIIFVGSLEERKGICVFAKALNIVFDKYPNIKIEFIGKDTNRNYKNISSIKLIKSIVNKKYISNLCFLGHLSNFELNKYLNSSKVAVFPSLFDNYPYVVLEAMTVGLHIVGSKNSGMVEMLDDLNSIYETGDYNDLAKKIIEKYELSFVEKNNLLHIKRVKRICNPLFICKKMICLYEKTINDYQSRKKIFKELQNVLNELNNEKIISYKQEKNGIANLVFQVETKENKYIIKKYLNDYNFDLYSKLYEKYDNSNLKYIKPINKKIIVYNLYKYNIFPYLNHQKYNMLDIDYLSKIICCDRNVDYVPTIPIKCEKYYLYLNQIKKINNNLQEDMDYIMKVFYNIKDIEIVNEKFINHGDLSRFNIIMNKTRRDKYIIDFDEVTITTPLYDFATVVVKNFFTDGIFDFKKYNLLKEKVKCFFPKYSDKDFVNIIKYYICKILLEKFYLHEKKLINLFSKEQKKDDYKKYLSILKEVEKL